MKKIVVILFAALVTGCPQPFDLDHLSQLQDLNAPTITINSPAAGTVFESTVTVSGTIYDLDAAGAPRTSGNANAVTASYDVIDSTPGTTPIDVAEDGSFSFSFDSIVYDSQITVIIYAADTNGNETQSTLTLIPDTAGPYIVISEPSDLDVFSLAITLAGTVTNSEGDTATDELAGTLHYELAGTSDFGELEIAEDGSFSTIIDATDLTGTVRIVLTAEDLNGNISTVTRSVVSDQNGPAITLTSPEDYTVYSQEISLSGSVQNGADDIGTDDLAGTVTYMIPGTTVEGSFDIESDGSFATTVDVSGITGSRRIEVRAADLKGNTSVATRTIVGDEAGPLLQITSPSDYDLFADAVTIAGTVQNSTSDTTISDVASLSWEILGISGTEASGTVDPIPADGDFVIPVTGLESLTGTLRTVVTAIDHRGNTTAITIPIEAETTAPYIDLTSPEDYEEYATVLTITGTVSTDAGGTDFSDITNTVGYRLPGTALSGTIPVNTGDGTFSALLDVSALDGSHPVEITATDAKGNARTLTVTVMKPSDGGDISGFTVMPGNKQVALSWDPVLLADSYTIAELSYGNTRSIDAGSSYLWTGLENGEEYLFQITAHIPDGSGEDAESSVVSVFPLSGRSLMPWINNSSYGEISLSWVDYPMVDRYTVQRGSSPDGPWSTVRTTLSNHYTDTSVSPGQSYYYRVTPASSDIIQSSPVSAASVSFSSGSATVVMPGDVLATEMAGDYLYSLCAHKPGSYIEGILVVTDISSPSNPQIVKQIDLGRTPFDLCLSGNILWIAMGINGILGFNISIPDAPFLAADLDTNSANSDVGMALCAAGSYVYLADGSEGVKIIDVSTPSSPQVKSTWTTDIEIATDIALSGDYLYVGVNNDHQWGSFARIDISDPLNPSGTFFPVGWECFYTEQFPEPRIDAEDGTVYLATYESYGVFINDGTVPAHSSPPLGIEFANVEAIGTDLYLMPAGDYGMYADAANPFSVSIGSHDFFNIVLTPSDMDINGTLYIASTHNPVPAQYSGSVIISDFNTPAGASLAATIETGDDALPYAVDAAGDDLYVLFSDGVINTKLGRYDGGTASPGSGDFSETFTVTGMGGAEPHYFDLAVSGGYAFAADGKNRITAVDISNPYSLGSPQHTQTPDTVYALEIVGPYAYAVGKGLYVLDISDPEEAEVIYIDAFDSGDILNAIIVDMDRIGDTLYLSGEGKIYTVDISDPENPGIITLVDDSLMVNSSNITLHGGDGFYLVLDDGSSNYRLDVWHPDTGGTFETVNGITDPTTITRSGDYALIGTKTGGLAVADISAFSASPAITTITTGDGRFITDTVIAGSYAYAVGFDESLDTNGVVWIIDLDG